MNNQTPSLKEVFIIKEEDLTDGVPQLTQQLTDILGAMDKELKSHRDKYPGLDINREYQQIKTSIDALRLKVQTWDQKERSKRNSNINSPEHTSFTPLSNKINFNDSNLGKNPNQ